MDIGAIFVLFTAQNLKPFLHLGEEIPMLRVLVEAIDQFSLQRLKISDSRISNPMINMYAPHLGRDISLLPSQSVRATRILSPKLRVQDSRGNYSR